jgi:hypothetical protein
VPKKQALPQDWLPGWSNNSNQEDLYSGGQALVGGVLVQGDGVRALLAHEVGAGDLFVQGDGLRDLLVHEVGAGDLLV